MSYSNLWRLLLIIKKGLSCTIVHISGLNKDDCDLFTLYIISKIFALQFDRMKHESFQDYNYTAQ